MSRPSGSNIQVKPYLNQFAIEYKNDEYVHEKIFPIVNVKKDSGYYYVFGRQNFQLYETKRQPRTVGTVIDFSATNTSTYAVQDHSAAAYYTDKDKANADDIVKLEMRKTNRAKDAILLRREASVFEILTDSTNFLNTGTPQNGKWNLDTSTPADDVDYYREAVKQAIGIYPNKMVVGYRIHNKLKRHPGILQYFKVQQGKLSAAMLAEFFEVEEYIVQKAMYSTTVETAALTSQTLSDFMGTNVALLYVPKTPAIDEPSFGYVVESDNVTPAETWKDDAESTTYIRANASYQVLETSASGCAGALLTSVID